jgi:hypothetical protein
VGDCLFVDTWASGVLKSEGSAGSGGNIVARLNSAAQPFKYRSRDQLFIDEP